MATWTRARLERTLRAHYGAGPRGGLNVAAAARDLGVSTSTVYRWLRAPSPRSRVKVPADKVDRLERAIDVEGYLVERERANANRARWAIGYTRTYGAQLTWARQEWLEPHEVRISQSSDGLIRQVTFGRIDAKVPKNRSVRVIARVEVSSRFHAEILVHEVLQKMARWRVPVEHPEIDVAATRSWTRQGAPAVKLDQLASGLPKPISKRRRLEARRRAGT